MIQNKIQDFNLSGEKTTGIDNLHKHPVYWFNDGSIVLQVQEQLFRVHLSLLSRLSPYFAGLRTDTLTNIVGLGNGTLAHDFRVLLEHLYHDIPLSTASTIDRFASILRITSPTLLDFPTLHGVAKEAFSAKFPRGPLACYRPSTNTLETLALATEYRLDPVRKLLLYSIVTNDEFDFLDGMANEARPHRDAEPAELKTNTAAPQKLSAADNKTCSDLMIKLIEHFTPVLFTPPTTPHIPCTDVIASAWAPLVAQPAITGEGLAKPLETLEQMKAIDWAGQGLCASCIAEKREEWTGEQQAIWDIMDDWLKPK
ncbi:hypothetical protein M378DRAFT_159925 [Amanita muscaria Koide BX008]|uniref:BTB domain-containing protein n=1 Tax=Amanita muscaria (strain Koide BX008) TaxID=946122 RepID=A0A0C2WYS2_AMAMK|nr:hypothetical protein M378DRAFT_159925 [Amanita muscaria Koide BX008]